MYCIHSIQICTYICNNGIYIPGVFSIGIWHFAGLYRDLQMPAEPQLDSSTWQLLLQPSRTTVVH